MRGVAFAILTVGIALLAADRQSTRKDREIGVKLTLLFFVATLFCIGAGL